jgi:hypothetical protein
MADANSKQGSACLPVLQAALAPQHRPTASAEAAAPRTVRTGGPSALALYP